jgi:dihydropteroate synthase
MGILNITPDSFFDGGKYNNTSAILFQVEKMLTEGAAFIDVGAYSSRPGAKQISEEVELNRILPITKLLIKEFPNILISIDTFRSNIAEQCVENGACLINDISAGRNPKYDDIIKDVLYYFSKKIAILHSLGINDIITDVGFGFGKTIEHNYQLLKNLELFKNLETPMLVGLSRKSMLYKPLQIKPDNALNVTTSANTIALLNGANILRVHDVKEAMEAIKIVQLLNN